MTDSIAANQTLLVVVGGISAHDGGAGSRRMQQAGDTRRTQCNVGRLMTVAYGGSAKQAGLDGHVIQPEKLRQIALRQK